jgi:pantetheine-phosphate adenylyltransferase
VTDRLVIAVARNAGKGPLFSIDERVEMTRDEIAAMDTHGTEVQVRAFDNLLIDFCHEVGASLLIRGLRAVSDFEYELQMAQMNQRIGDVETVFLSTSPEWSYLSSSLVKEVARYGGAVSGTVPAIVEERLVAKLAT